MPHPDVFWYHLNSMGTQKNVPKKVLVTFFPYIFHIKTRWNIVYKCLKTFLFKRHKYPSPNALNIKYFWTLSYNHWEFLGITKLSNPWLQENGMPPKCLNLALPRIWLIFTSLWDHSNCWMEWLLSKLSTKHGIGTPCTDRLKKILFNVWIVSACYI